MESSPAVHVACLVLIDDAGRIFAARRPPGKRLGDLWEFPGGKVDPGESIEVALRRELTEELGMKVGTLVAMDPVDHRYEFGTIRLWPMLARCDGAGRPAYQLHEHTEARWVDGKQAALLDWAPADRPVLRALGMLNHA